MEVGSPWFLFFALALLGAVGWSLREGARRGIPRVVVIDVGIAALVGGMVGGRVHHVLFEPLPAESSAWFVEQMPPGGWQDAARARLAVDPADVPVRWWYAARPAEVVALGKGGFGLLGGVSLAVLLSVLAVRRHRRGPDDDLVGRTADLAAPAVALGVAIGRIGCAVSGCCHGRACPPGWPLERWPTALLEAAWAGGLFLLLRRPGEGPPGQRFLLLLWLYAPGRFLLELLRGDPRGAALGLSTSQWWALLLGAPALAAWLVRGRRGGTPAPT